MKKILEIIVVVCLLAAVLSACGEKKAPAASATDIGKETQQQASLPNPIKEYGSLEEINELTHGHLMHPAVMGVADERFSVIDCGEYRIAQYNYTVNGIPYTYRFSPSVVSDISGIYDDGGTLFGSEIKNEVKEFSGGKAYRFFNTDGQYVLTAQDDGALSLDTFQMIAQEQENLASMGSEN